MLDIEYINIFPGTKSNHDGFVSNTLKYKTQGTFKRISHINQIKRPRVEVQIIHVIWTGFMRSTTRIIVLHYINAFPPTDE